MASTHVTTGHNTLKITDSYLDSATFQINETGIFLVIEHRRAVRGGLSVAISEQSAIALRDALLKDFPLPKVEQSVTVSSVGELSSIEVTGGGGVVIHANGNVIVNNK